MSHYDNVIILLYVCVCKQTCLVYVGIYECRKVNIYLCRQTCTNIYIDSMYVYACMYIGTHA